LTVETFNQPEILLNCLKNHPMNHHKTLEAIKNLKEVKNYFRNEKRNHWYLFVLFFLLKKYKSLGGIIDEKTSQEIGFWGDIDENFDQFFGVKEMNISPLDILDDLIPELMEIYCQNITENSKSGLNHEKMLNRLLATIGELIDIKLNSKIEFSLQYEVNNLK